MNRTKIEWTDFTWNPVTGCLRGCDYCYARRIYHRFKRSFEPAFRTERLFDPCDRRKPARIFVCSTADLFGPWVPDEWIYRVLQVARSCPDHTFQYLTKFPARLARFQFPSNSWVGTTATDHASSRSATAAMALVRAPVRFLSAEPMIGEVELWPDEWIPDWIIIGRQTGPGAPALPLAAAFDLTSSALGHGVAVFHKPGVHEHLTRREFPAPFGSGMTFTFTHERL